jgi:hypothetical protein
MVSGTHQCPNTGGCSVLGVTVTILCRIAGHLKTTQVHPQPPIPPSIPFADLIAPSAHVTVLQDARVWRLQTGTEQPNVQNLCRDVRRDRTLCAHDANSVPRTIPRIFKPFGCCWDASEQIFELFH